ncbi:GPI1 [Sanghuangporus weigelae]
MTRSKTVFWPADIQRRGFVFGWKNTDTTVVSGTCAFEGQADAESILTRVNSILSQDSTSTRPLELLGTIPSRKEPLVTEVIWQNTIDWPDQKEIVYYKRPKYGSMRHYSLLGIDLDLLLTIPSAEKATSLDAQHNKIQSSQDCFTEKRICFQRGIDSCSIDQMNSADRIMTQLRSAVERSVLSEPRSANSPTTSHALLVVKRLCEICADLLYSLRISVPRLYEVGTNLYSLASSVQQLDLRCEQTVFVLRQAWLLDHTKETSNDKISAHYISTQNCIWLILNDVIIGCAVGIFLTDNNKYLARMIHTFVETWIVDSIRGSIHWLDNWPAGLKLNTELSRFLFLVFNALLDSWEVVLKIVGGLLPSVITIIGISGILGMTMILASLSDLISLLSIHLSISYAITRVAFKTQLLMAKSLFNLFRGKRYNVLRARVDDWDYDLDQLLLGAMLLTLINFLFPTITVYYMLFALTRLGVQALQAGIKIALALLNHFPLFALTLRIKDPWRLPGGIVFRPYRPIRLNEQEPSFISQNSPITLSKIFGQYYALGAKLGTHYNPSRLIKELLKGNPLDPIPPSSIRYSYGTHAPSG